MEAKTFFLVAGVIFAVVALFHLVRIVMDWSVIIGDRRRWRQNRSRSASMVRYGGGIRQDRLLIGFSDDRRFFVLVLLFVFFVLVIIVVIRVSRRGRSADEGPVEQLGGNVFGDVRSHVGACFDFEVFAD